MPPPTVGTLKGGLLIFWAAWFTIVFLTNLFDALRALGLLGAGWRFASGNWAFLVETTAVYGTPDWLRAVLFAGVIAWEGLAALLFWRAVGTRQGGERRPAVAAFVVGIALWAAFAIADELCLAYDVEATHLRLFTAQVVSLLVIELVPEERAAGGAGGKGTGG